MKRILSISFMIMLAVVMLFSSAPIHVSAASPNMITIAQEGEPGNLNPFVWPTTSDTNVTHMIFDSLVKPSPELELQPALAESWEISEDGLVYTFKLRDGVTWHDGEAFDAEDVAFTFSSIASPEYDSGSYSRVEPVKGASEYHDGSADSVEGIKVIDPLTVEFTLKEPNASFLAQLFIAVVPEHILKDVSPADWAKDDFNRSPIGTGPFSFVRWEAAQFIELKANPDYYDGAPKVEGIIYRFGDPNTMLAAFLNEEVDIAPVPVAEVPGVEQDGQIKLSNDLSVFYVGFNLKNSHFADLTVRQALAHATDKDLIVSSILGDYGYVLDDIFPLAHWSHNPDLPKYEYDLAKAEELLEGAGYEKDASGIYAKDGEQLSFTLSVPTGKVEREKTGVMLMEQWNALGVKVEIQQLDFPTLVTHLLPKTADGKQREVEADDFDAYILGFGVEADPDEYRPYFHSGFMPPNGYNFCSYSTPTMDELMEKQLVAVDFEERKALFYEIGLEFAENEPWIPIYGQQSVFVANNRVQGFEPDFRGVSFTAKDWSLAD